MFYALVFALLTYYRSFQSLVFPSDILLIFKMHCHFHIPQDSTEAQFLIISLATGCKTQGPEQFQRKREAGSRKPEVVIFFTHLQWLVQMRATRSKMFCAKILLPLSLPNNAACFSRNIFRGSGWV